MKYQNAIVGQRVQVKSLTGLDDEYFNIGDVGTITEVDDDESITKHCRITLDGNDEQCDRPMYPRQLRKVKGDAPQ